MTTRNKPTRSTGALAVAVALALLCVYVTPAALGCATPPLSGSTPGPDGTTLTLAVCVADPATPCGRHAAACKSSASTMQTIASSSPDAIVVGPGAVPGATAVRVGGGAFRVICGDQGVYLSVTCDTAVPPGSLNLSFVDFDVLLCDYVFNATSSAPMFCP